MKTLHGLWAACLFAPALVHALDSPVLAEVYAKLGVHSVDSLEYEAAGRYYQFGQAPAPGLPWPAFDVDRYVATLDYARGAVHAKYHRVQVQEPGRARPHSEQTQDQYAVDGVTWNLAPGPVAMPVNLDERNAELWASPHGFLKAARANQARVERLDADTMRVSFTLRPNQRYEGVVSRNGYVVSVRTFMDSAVLGDTPIEFRYSGYRAFGEVHFPARIERRVADLPWYELQVSAVRVNAALPFAVPAEIAANPVPSVAGIEVGEIAPGVWNFGGGSHNTVVVEQSRGVVVIEAPIGEQRSQAILQEIRRRFGPRIRGVINTHAHFDHAGGLRTFVAAGVPVITHQRNAAYFETAWRQPRTLNPDVLAKSARRARFETFTEKLLLDDAQRPIEVHTIAGSGHNDAFAMAYLPKQRLLVEADAWTPAPPGAAPPAVVNPLWVNLHDNIVRLNLDVDRIAPLHGGVQTLQALRAAIGRPDP